MQKMLSAAKAAKKTVSLLSTRQKNDALEAMAQALLDRQEEILAANQLEDEGAIPRDRLLLIPRKRS